MWPFRKKGPAEDAPPSQHHYVLAHVALRTVCMQNPLAFFALMASPERDGFLEVLWQDLCRNCGAGPAPFGIRDLSFGTGRIKGFPRLLIRMPPPTSMAEAHMVCVVLKADLSGPEPSEHPEVGYYTLEKGFNLDGSERTVLCAWTADGSHVNYGDGPAATDEAFLAAVEKLLV